jgi:hypothetical protein
MTHRRSGAVVAIVLAIALAAPAVVAAQTGAQPSLVITLTSRPSPPKTGDNAFEVVVKDPSGKPVTDADVSVQFYMAAMPAMKMPEMKNTVTLKHAKDGVYTGTGKVMMAGGWDATVSVKRSGKEVASRKFPITAK